MGLSSVLHRVATVRPAPYVVEVPGGARVRWALEDEAERRGWTLARSPASADALVVAGPLPGGLRAAAELLWGQLPGPRSRVTLERAEDVPAALDQLQADLRDRAAQRRDAAGRDPDQTTPWVHAEPGEEQHGDHHEDQDGHGDHGDHGDMDMSPGGISLAEGGGDRDGLEMDRLVHPLGPLLDRWPGGLELRATLHGDLVADVDVAWHGTPDEAEATTTGAAAWDAVATTLSLLGDHRWSRRARTARAVTAEGGQVDPAGVLATRSRIERLARWSVLPTAAGRALDRALDSSTSEPAPSLDDHALADLLAGQDLADVRLLVAAHAPLLRAPTTRSASGG